MSYKFSECQHVNQIDDPREGITVCTTCGLVINDQFFQYEDVKKETFQETTKLQNDILEILERLNFSRNHVESIEKNIREITYKGKRASKKEVLAASVYKSLNKESNVLSIKDVEAVSGVSKKKINNLDSSIHILKAENVLEKYCNLNNLDYKNYTVIKENMYRYKILGHNPLTLVGSVIYMHCRKNKIKTSMKKISETLGISTISIQRFIKNELSFRC
jgi:transcription initiation factor TFIIIB Brf1 subunit/transcription initiation factor TFIIB